MKTLKLIGIIIGVICFGYSGQSQIIEKFSIDNGGNSVTSGTIHVLYTIGEVNLQEISIGNIQVSEGFINPFIEGTLSVHTEPTFNNIIVFPNPASNILYVQSTNITISRLEMYSVQGKQLFKIEDSLNKINIEFLNSGIYFLKIVFDKGETMKKIIIN